MYVSVKLSTPKQNYSLITYQSNCSDKATFILIFNILWDVFYGIIINTYKTIVKNNQRVYNWS